MNIRQANRDDLDHLIDIDSKCFDHWLWPLDHWRKSNYRVLVAEVKSQVVGFAAWTEKPFQLPNANFTCSANVVWLLKVAVKQSHRGKGIGSALSTEVRKFALKQGACIILSVVPESIGTSVGKWLNNRGFKATNIAPGSFYEYGDEVDGYLFDLVLKEADKLIGAGI